jgi:LemA protein
VFVSTLVWLIFGGLASVAVGVLVFAYYINRIIVLSNRIDGAWSQIDVQLKRRAELVPNLVNTVKGYMKHEEKMIKTVTDARERMVGNSDINSRLKANSDLTKALKTVFAIAENYPKLMASENFKLLQEQLEGIENKVAYSRQFYNDSVLGFNNMITTMPGSWFARLIGKSGKREYLEAAEGERKPVKVEF